ncbi:long-chain fatty acid--CoA ligase [Nitrogeniibacter mangrovi]|uniref:Long-chain fatty acid--CoA ligase n=1 Tax=Nitrogeniibacter mangrovi TaxID=2016596 RepID=A0A6C1AY10_9RHOO|nr:AMP-binding protein [Nitrogeniibacter mangrovi]QID16251.1 long-chain fatty acid--CoA ligase [Nitrogeniibacter mangrovi]
MNIVLSLLRRHAATQPDHIALADHETQLDYRSLLHAVEALADRLHNDPPRTLALWADNGVAWVVADLAAALAGIPIVPLPLFFSPTQMAHVMASAGVDRVLTDQPQRFQALFPQYTAAAGRGYGALHPLTAAHGPAAALPADTVKVTFTSGTTGEPKGVCLDGPSLSTVASALAGASDAQPGDRHLCVLPLATLLENVGGVYAGLIAGATVCVPALAEVGLAGSSGLDVGRLLTALDRWRATTAILVPQMLQALLGAARAGLPMPRHLRYVALGGAPVSAQLLDEANGAGLPVFEGYGLSECASVVAVNTPAAHRPGSVGRPLPHVDVHIAADGEIHVGGIAALGYLGDTPANRADRVATGDLGHVDADGFLYLTGRKKHLFITAFGRNVAPEWVERELLGEPGILQAAVFGEARPFNCAVVVPAPGAAPARIEQALARANDRLPDYARVHAWVPATEPFSLANGMCTANGRPRRNVIGQRYAAHIAAVYPS